ncbi:class I SAM-dependent methyltransferase [Coleofasciculus sp. E2-BRE-01]|uniref:class I SAM-dependent methyltransferase n=1 Tax=Coleofasciculus sp. E2-BRE-01 TaxID=3069524 RepID=UPI0032F56CED
MKCRHCHETLKLSFIDLGSAPPSNAYLTPEQLHASEKWFPLRVLVCTNCWLVQTEDFTDAAELFDASYAYFSSFSQTWLAHAERYVADVMSRFDLNGDSYVVEVAANDGYLLQYFKDHNIACLGVEPTASTAAAARRKGIEVVEDFFSVRLARELVNCGKQADLIAANNVLAHVPDINDFVSGFAMLLKPQGVATFEFPHLLRLIEGNQFDTVYHEHFSYLSLTAVQQIFTVNGLRIFDVEEHSTHGGSLRVFAQHRDSGSHSLTSRVDGLLDEELKVGLSNADFYSGFQKRANRVKDDFLTFLLKAKRQEKVVAGYGAAAKGNTLLNYAGIRPDLLSFVVDRNPVKQGKFMPGSRIPIVEELSIQEMKPDYIVILPWNLKTEVMNQLGYIREWGGQFVTAVPQLEVIK